MSTSAIVMMLVAMLVIWGGLALAVVGWVVEGFCRLPPDDPDAEESAEYRRGREKELPEGEGGYAREIRERPRPRPRGLGAR